MQIGNKIKTHFGSKGVIVGKGRLGGWMVEFASKGIFEVAEASLELFEGTLPTGTEKIKSRLAMPEKEVEEC